MGHFQNVRHGLQALWLEIVHLHSRKPCPVPSNHDLPDVKSRLHSSGGPHKPHVPGHGPGGCDHLLQPVTFRAGRDSLTRWQTGHNIGSWWKGSILIGGTGLWDSVLPYPRGWYVNPFMSSSQQFSTTCILQRSAGLLTQTTATKKAVLIMSLLRGSSFVSPQLVKRINTVF